MVVLSLILAMILLMITRANESFTADGAAAGTRDVWTSNVLNHGTWVEQKGNGAWKAREGNMRDKELAVVYTANGNDTTTLAEMKGYFVSIASRSLAFRIDCGFNIGGMRVGYFDVADLQFINALIQGYRLDANKVYLIPISPTKENISNLEHMLDTSLDIVITYITPDSQFHKLLQAQRIAVLGFKTIDIERIKVFMNDIGIEDVNLNSLWSGGAAVVMAREKDTRLPILTARVIEAQASIENFVTSFHWDPVSTDSRYMCYGDKSNTIRYLCESKYDVIGQKKTSQSTWDKPCEKNEDCPFWDEAQQRGGCDKDFSCELPVAVKRLGFMKFDATGVNEPFYKNSRVVFPSKK